MKSKSAKTVDECLSLLAAAIIGILFLVWSITPAKAGESVFAVGMTGKSYNVVLCNSSGQIERLILKRQGGTESMHKELASINEENPNGFNCAIHREVVLKVVSNAGKYRLSLDGEARDITIVEMQILAFSPIPGIVIDLAGEEPVLRYGWTTQKVISKEEYLKGLPTSYREA